MPETPEWETGMRTCLHRHVRFFLWEMKSDD